MNANYRQVPAQFGPEMRFEVKPAPPAPFRATQETGLEQLKARLLSPWLNDLTEPELSACVRRAANEAAALAWVTSYPLLMFPALFEEKARTVMLQAKRQANVRQRSRQLLAV
jgi:hypothetical protein